MNKFLVVIEWQQGFKTQYVKETKATLMQLHSHVVRKAERQGIAFKSITVERVLK